MKTLKSMIFGLALLIVCGVAKASDKPVHDKLTKTDVLNIYIDAVSHGKLDNLENVLDNDVKFNTSRGERVSTYNKTQMLNYFKSTQNVEQECKCSTSVIEDNDDYTVVKLDMKYDNYVRTNLITIKRSGKGWKITNVDTSIK